ncbi:MAG: asparagine synthase (glutamine-hydrolyzing) [Candidatus Omnitrophota bacterium]
MCGIFGIYYSDKSKNIDQNLVVDATNLMHHRGPDDSGFYVKNNIGLGHRRLSIIDLSHGHQPMFNEDNSITVVYNGEIYNHVEIKTQLIAKGHVFKTKCDTEVIIHAYEEWGYESVEKFNGMFAFIVCDYNKKILWIVRDRLGIKPLYYFWDKQVFICASEIKAILSTKLINAQINEQVLDSYFTLGYVPGPQTMFKNIYKVNPGNFLIIKGCELIEEKYWDFNQVETGSFNLEKAKSLVEEVLRDSIAKRLMSDVSLGVFLSGGLDSSAVVALMSEVVNNPIKTFTVSYDKKFNVGEDEYAQAIAKKFNTEHHVFNLEPENFLASVNTLVDFSEEPIVEPAAIALYHISKLARENAIVLLSGEGSDEVFAGYFLYQFMNNINKLHQAVPPYIWRLFKPTMPLINSTKYTKYFDWLMLPAEKSYLGTSNYLTDSLRQKFYSPDFLQVKGSYLKETFDNYFERVKHKKSFINKMLYVDTKTWLVDDLLLKADKMTMAASIELRVPFLDYRLVELAASMPDNLKINKSNGKFILKSIMKNRLPDYIINRKKMGFPVPTKNWFCQDIFEKIKDILISKSHDLPWWKKEMIEKLLKEHSSKQEDHSKLLMMLLVFINWKDKYIDGNY